LTMVFSTPKHSLFFFQKNSSIPATAPFNLLKSFFICVILLVWGVGSASGEIKTGNLTSGVWTAVTYRMARTMSATGINETISANRVNINTIPIISLTRMINSLETVFISTIASICILFRLVDNLLNFY